MRLPFVKYNGTGNDFIIIDNRNNIFSLLNKNKISNLCNRNFGIGADGIILIQDDEDSDFNMIYYNSDGNIGIGTNNPQINIGLDIEYGTQTKAKFGSTAPIYIIAGDPHIGFNAYYDSEWKFGKGSTAHSASLIGCGVGVNRTFILTSSSTGTAGAAANMVERFSIINSLLLLFIQG